ncbi:MAG TPA: type VI secretion system ImpA family N-terminal domain-containing protein [Beijerinckiaceae bacterium]|nr:type VI secretion system ImpA family N-terminal domain-containing protein [Beijerinckiaceae bacterium]
MSGGAPDLDPSVAVLCTPLSEANPCGPDLDMVSDPDYLNFFAGAEGILPTSFFAVEDGSPFDRTTIDIDRQLNAFKPLLGRTRDVRLLILQARFLILNKDLGGFAANVAATAFWLSNFWEAVHPRPQAGDLVARSAAIGALDLPTVIFPLQYAPLVESRRIGQISYRVWMIATGEVKPRSGEVQQTQAAIADAIGNADPATLATVRKHLSLLKTSLDGIRNVFQMNGESAGLDALLALVGKIRTFIDPQASAKAAVDDAGGGDDSADAAPDGSPSGAAGAAPASLAQANEALAAIADYYGRMEPSSPILLLVRQAQQLIGKSFFEVMSILMPAHVEKAAFHIGADEYFDLPVEKLSNFSEVRAMSEGGAQPTDGSDAGADGPRYRVDSRAQAITLLDQVNRYFRRSEPSSPVPMLCDRARVLAERDFMAVLADVLPKKTLRKVGQADD